jgi:putative Mg2+ transporter-C (MgtC) family protein
MKKYLAEGDDMISEIDMILRILAAAALGGIIGFERERNHQPAGLRTHMVLVSGAALAMTLSINLAGTSFDPARLAAQVIAGIGFLGAGAILRFGPTVRGLTTAASLWTMAVVGLAVGAGYVLVGTAITALLLIVLTIVNWFEARFVKKSLVVNFVIYAVDRPGIEQEIRRTISANCKHIDSFRANRNIRRQRIKLEAQLRLKAGETIDSLSVLLGNVKGVRILKYE